VSPALLVQVKRDRLVATRLDSNGVRAQQTELPVDQPSIVAMRPGVAQPLAADTTRRGTIRREAINLDEPSHILTVEHRPPDPRQSDIRHLPKLIAGGSGVGSREGFETLWRIAAKLDAGVAASRMAVDLGWIDVARQVGQTGKTVRPDLYLACGISGASHHLEGMSDSRHIVAVNTDPLAPLMLQAELALQADLHQVLHELDRLLESTT
jgi:electron transfer flavoprotein alpha subunit